MFQQTRPVPETRFGTWFQQTDVWRRHVVARALDDLEALLRQAGGPDRFDRVLDAGCGAGVAFAEIAGRFGPGRITAVDTDPKMVAAARRVAARGPWEIDVREDDIEACALPDAGFDMILCHQTLHHVSRQDAALAEMRRLLVPGGVLLLAESCRRFTQSLAVRALFRHPEENQRSPDAYLDLVREAGLAFDSGCTSRPDPFWARPDFGLLERLGGRPPAAGEGTQVHVVARRP